MVENASITNLLNFLKQRSFECFPLENNVNKNVLLFFKNRLG